MSQGEFHELVGEMVDDGKPDSGTLQAWYAGEPITALEFGAALQAQPVRPGRVLVYVSIRGKATSPPRMVHTTAGPSPLVTRRSAAGATRQPSTDQGSAATGSGGSWKKTVSARGRGPLARPLPRRRGPLRAPTDAYVNLAVIASAAVIALGLPIADPIIGLAITGVILRITRQSWATVRGSAHSH